jgi:hypothetical protein
MTPTPRDAYEEIDTGQFCPCRKDAHRAPVDGIPWCNGVLRRYPSGAVACDCGHHVTHQRVEEGR